MERTYDGIIKDLRCECEPCKGHKCNECEYDSNEESYETILDQMRVAADAIEALQSECILLRMELCNRCRSSYDEQNECLSRYSVVPPIEIARCSHCEWRHS